MSINLSARRRPDHGMITGRNFLSLGGPYYWVKSGNPSSCHGLRVRYSGWLQAVSFKPWKSQPGWYWRPCYGFHSAWPFRENGLAHFPEIREYDCGEVFILRFLSNSMCCSHIHGNWQWSSYVVFVNVGILNGSVPDLHNQLSLSIKTPSISIVQKRNFSG